MSDYLLEQMDRYFIGVDELDNIGIGSNSGVSGSSDT